MNYKENKKYRRRLTRYHEICQPINGRMCYSWCLCLNWNVFIHRLYCIFFKLYFSRKLGVGWKEEGVFIRPAKVVWVFVRSLRNDLIRSRLKTWDFKKKKSLLSNIITSFHEPLENDMDTCFIRYVYDEKKVNKFGDFEVHNYLLTNTGCMLRELHKTTLL